MSTDILVCCDNMIMGAGIRALLSQHSLSVSVETSVRRAATVAAETSPEALIVVSPALTVDDRGELAELARLSKVILLAKPENAHRAFEVLRVSVRAVLSVESSVDDLIHVIRAVTKVNALVVPAAAGPSLGTLEMRETLIAPAVENTLTGRESEVLRLLTQGKSNSEIAKELSVSDATIRSHVHHVLRKLGAGTRAQAVALAYGSGLIEAIERRALRGGRAVDGTAGRKDAADSPPDLRRAARRALEG